MISKFFSLDDSLQRNEKKYGGKKTKYFIQKIKIVFSLIKKGKISLPKLFNVFKICKKLHAIKELPYK